MFTKMKCLQTLSQMRHILLIHPPEGSKEALRVEGVSFKMERT